MVMPNLVGQALRGEPLTVFGDGHQTRCFSYVGDIVPALVRLAEETRAYGQAFNLGGAREVSILVLAKRIVEVLGSTSSIELVPYDQAYGEGFEDVRRRVPDNSQAERLSGFRPVTGLDEMIVAVAAGLGSRHRSTVLFPWFRDAANTAVSRKDRDGAFTGWCSVGAAMGCDCRCDRSCRVGRRM
jgi:UDP-glucose 4-epimerase